MLDLIILIIISIIIAIKYPWFGFYVFAVAYTYASYSLEATGAVAFVLPIAIISWKLETYAEKRNEKAANDEAEKAAEDLRFKEAVKEAINEKDLV